MKHEVRRSRNDARAIARAAAVVLLAAVAVPPAHSATQRIVIERGSNNAATNLSGPTEIVVIPPVDDAIVTISVDGEKIATRSMPPYSVEVDFGPSAVEHTIGVVVKDDNGKRRAAWAEVVNDGNRPLTIELERHDGPQASFDATVTAPGDDPVVSVEFFDSDTLLGTVTKPPYRVSPPEGAAPTFVYATARTRSGAEITDYYSDGGDAQFGSYQVRTVPLYVSVVDERGNARANLDSSKFRILDSGKEGKILEFGLAEAEPISVAMVFDASASMTYEMRRAMEAAQRFVENVMRQDDRFAVFAVRTSPRREVGLTGDRNAVAASMQSMRADGKTALYDGVYAAVRELKDEKNRRAIVILSDGGDTSSVYSYDDMFSVVKQAGIPVYVIAFGHAMENSDDEIGRALDQLGRLASQTGGFAVTATSGNLRQKYDQVERDLRSQYVIKYQVTDSPRPNQWRAVEVKLRDSNLKARTIRGYFTR